jgi:hypothetical protein
MTRPPRNWRHSRDRQLTLTVDQEDPMKRMSQTVSTFVGSFLNVCLLSFALAFLLVGSNVAMTKLLAWFV